MTVLVAGPPPPTPDEALAAALKTVLASARCPLVLKAPARAWLTAKGLT